MQRIFKRYKKFFLFCLIILILGNISGIIYYNFLDVSIKENISITLAQQSFFNYNFILKHLIIMSVILVLSFLLIGLPIGFCYLLYEGFSLGFLVSIFFASFKFSGILYFIIYLLLNKLVVLILYILFLKRIFDISRNIIGVIIYKRDSNILNKIYLNFKKCIYFILFVLVLNIALYFLNPVIFKFFSFLL